MTWALPRVAGLLALALAVASACGGEGFTWVATPADGAGGRTGEHGDAVCEPAYPDVCIPPAPPDLDCAEVPFRGFRVFAPDPHRFDVDGNGLGCER